MPVAFAMWAACSQTSFRCLLRAFVPSTFVPPEAVDFNASSSAIATLGVMPWALISASIHSGISQICSHRLQACNANQTFNYRIVHMLPSSLTVGPECHFDPKYCLIKHIGGLFPVTSPLLLQASSPIFQQVHSSLSDILSSVFKHFQVTHRSSYLLM
jgi:hypothetical protein